MRAVFCVVALLLVGAAVARPIRLNPPIPFRNAQVPMALDDVQTTEDVVNFLKGMAVGMEIKLAQDPAACAKEIKNISTDVKDAYEHLKNGIHKKSVKEVMIGIVLLGDALENSAKAFKDCGVERAAMDIMKIVAEIKSGNIKAFIKDEIVHIWHERKELIHIVTEGVEAYKAKNWFLLGEDTGEFVAILIDVGSDIELKPIDAANLIKGIAEGMGATMGDPSACMRDIDEMIADFNSAWQDMLNGIRRLNVRVIKRAIQEFAAGLNVVADSFSACGLEKAQEEIKKIVAQIKAGKLLEVIVSEVAHIFCHGKELINLFKDAATQWKATQFEACGKDVGRIIGFLIVIPPVRAL